MGQVNLAGLGRLAQALSLGMFSGQRFSHNVGKYVHRSGYLLGERSDTKRHWHDRTEFYQSNALEAAAGKRRRRAEKLAFNTESSVRNNQTTQSYKGPFPDRVCRANLNPFYINKGSN